MAIALVASVSENPGQSGGASGAIDTTGADLLVFVATSYNGFAAPTVSDSKGNTWVGLAEQSAAINSRVRIYYAKNPTVGSGHTFTVTGNETYPAVLVFAFSGADTDDPFDQENGATAGSVTSHAAGSVTPSENGEVLVGGLCYDGDVTNLAIGSSFTLELHEAYTNAVNMGGAAAYKIQGTAGAENPSWSWTTARNVAASIATFKAAAGGGADPEGSLIGGKLIRGGLLLHGVLGR